MNSPSTPGLMEADRQRESPLSFGEALIIPIIGCPEAKKQGVAMGSPREAMIRKTSGPGDDYFAALDDEDTATFQGRLAP